MELIFLLCQHRTCESSDFFGAICKLYLELVILYGEVLPGSTQDKRRE